MDWTAYEKRVAELEAEGMTRSDAQGVADAEGAGRRAIEKIEFEKVEISEQQEIINTYNFINADYTQGLNYKVERELYEKSMKLFKGTPREGEIDAKTYLHDVWDAKNKAEGRAS